MTTDPERSARSTNRTLRTWALVLALGACGQAIGGERGQPDVGRPRLLGRLGPAGGWHPDSGGLLHWWNPCCFPRGGGPDDYCRKPPPNVCWPPYPAFSTGCPSPVGQPCRCGAHHWRYD